MFLLPRREFGITRTTDLRHTLAIRCYLPPREVSGFFFVRLDVKQKFGIKKSFAGAEMNIALYLLLEAYESTNPEDYIGGDPKD